MPTRRLERLNEQLKREISLILRSRVQDPRVDGVVVTGAETTADLSYAKVWVRAPAEMASEEALAGLEAAAPFIRRILGQGLRIRRVPELLFRRDETLERANRIEELLREVDLGSEDQHGPGDDTEKDGPDA